MDRSRTTTDWKCPRARYWGYEYLGRGVRPVNTSLALSTGILLHDALAAIATFQQKDGKVDIDTIASLAFRQMVEALTPDDVVMSEAIEFAKEQASLTEGLIRGFYKHVWPRLLDMYPRIFAIEKEVEYRLGEGSDCPKCLGTGVYIPNEPGPLLPFTPEDAKCQECGGTGKVGGIIFMAKPDLLMEDKNGDLVYVEYKSTSSKKEQWVNSWDTAVQLHSSIKAVEETVGRAPTYVQIVGLYKGYESFGKQSSPFCYAYQKKGNPPFTQDQVGYEYKFGFKRYPTWELEGGVKKWVEGMPEEVLANQFPMTSPIFVNEDLVESFFKQRLTREQEITSFFGNEDIDRVFPQKFDACQPAYGSGCEFKRLCHGGGFDSPLEIGYSFREPHHKRELERFEELAKS